MLVDCDTCAARGPACDDCVVTVILAADAPVELDAPAQAAIGALADSGLVPPLRLSHREAG
jgi:hypothetical protein